ncbi:restriction endonuclease subunit S [Aliivibrio fischeri]|uniref:restriction endonuclease subunit S n=1 Tax=Aliivibrio fischeri TaxID=668 RepID=UPI000A9A6EA3|nr:restriction endonuclease subunit S [Aliivibrio fischeri]
MSKYPSDWPSKPLGKVYPKIVVGYVGNVNDHYCRAEEGVPFYRTLNIRDGYFRHSEHLYVTHEFNEKNKKSQITNNDILIARVGANLGMVCKANGISSLANMANAIIIKTNDVNSADADFYTSFLLSPMGKNQIYSGAAGGAQGVFNTKLTQEIIVPVPPLPEQRKIAKILSTWDRGIATTEKLIDASKQQKKALMQQLLTGKKRLVDPETGMAFEGEWRKSKTPYESLPSDWSELALEKLSSFITKGATPTTYGFEWQEYGIPFLRSECVGKNGFKESGLNYICDAAHEAMARSKVYAGDILITITGNVGRVCRLPNKYPQANINQHIAKVTLKDENVCSDFIFHCLQDNKYQSNFERITTGQAYPQISLVQVRNTIVPLPPISEQQKIASVLIAADKEIELLEAKLAHLKQEKKALMQQLLTGKRRVQVEAA